MIESYDKNQFVLVFQDYLSKWPEVYVYADMRSYFCIQRFVVYRGLLYTEACKIVYNNYGFIL